MTINYLNISLPVTGTVKLAGIFLLYGASPVPWATVIIKCANGVWANGIDDISWSHYFNNFPIFFVNISQISYIALGPNPKKLSAPSLVTDNNFWHLNILNSRNSFTWHRHWHAYSYFSSACFMKGRFRYPG